MGYCFAKQAPGDHHRLASIIGQRLQLDNSNNAQIPRRHWRDRFLNFDALCSQKYDRYDKQFLQQIIVVAGSLSLINTVPAGCYHPGAL